MHRLISAVGMLPQAPQCPTMPPCPLRPAPARPLRSSIEVFCYALSPSDGSEWRQRITAEAEHFLDVSAWGVAEIAQRISADGIHIAGGRAHAAGGRAAAALGCWSGRCVRMSAVLVGPKAAAVGIGRCGEKGGAAPRPLWLPPSSSALCSAWFRALSTSP